MVLSELRSCWICFSVRVKTAWEREEVSFIFVLAVVRFKSPIFMRRSISS